MSGDNKNNFNRVSLSTASMSSAVYAVCCYLVAVLAMGGFVLFASDLLLPRTVNSLAPEQAWGTAISLNLLLLSLFGIQHSVMAREGFKRTLNRWINPDLERSTYCLATALVLFALVWFWVPFGGVVWSVDTPWLTALLRVFSCIGWGIAIAATYMLDHAELFGLKQGCRALIGSTASTTEFKEPLLYRYVRHPMQSGILLGVWSVPVSTVSHCMLAVGITLYILIGLHFEERALAREFGDQYADYKSRVKRLIPFVY